MYKNHLDKHIFGCFCLVELVANIATLVPELGLGIGFELGKKGKTKSNEEIHYCVCDHISSLDYLFATPDSAVINQ